MRTKGASLAMVRFPQLTEGTYQLLTAVGNQLDLQLRSRTGHTTRYRESGLQVLDCMGMHLLWIYTHHLPRLPRDS